MKSNYQTFEEAILLKWLDAYEKVVIVVITLHMLKYPITSIEFDWGTKVGIDNPFPVLESFEIGRIKGTLPIAYIQEIQNIALNDYETQELYKHIISMPDMTEAEIEKQIINLDKSMIESGQGFVAWEKQELQWLDKVSDEGKNKILHRIEVIRKWAVEKNMMKPKLERLKEEGFFKSSTIPTSDKGDA